ncbi:MAG: DUF3592 domain-containing protein [Desulfatibacillaceae bacterium]
MDRLVPDPFTIAQKDWFSRYICILGAVTLLFFLATMVLPEPFASQRILLGTIFLVEILAIAIRVLWLGSIMGSGKKVQGTILDVRKVGSGAGSRLVADYCYKFDDREYRRVCFDGGRFTQGQNVLVIVDPEHPKRSVIADLYRVA